METKIICPITGCLLTEPVITKYNNVYELTAIKSWVTHHQTDPANDSPLNHNEYQSCQFIQDIVNQYCYENPSAQRFTPHHVPIKSDLTGEFANHPECVLEYLMMFQKFPSQNQTNFMSYLIDNIDLTDLLDARHIFITCVGSHGTYDDVIKMCIKHESSFTRDDYLHMVKTVIHTGYQMTNDQRIKFIASIMKYFCGMNFTIFSDVMMSDNPFDVNYIVQLFFILFADNCPKDMVKFILNSLKFDQQIYLDLKPKLIRKWIDIIIHVLLMNLFLQLFQVIYQKSIVHSFV